MECCLQASFNSKCKLLLQVVCVTFISVCDLSTIAGLLRYIHNLTCVFPHCGVFYSLLIFSFWEQLDLSFLLEFFCLGVFCFFKYCILNIRKTQPMNGGSSSFLFLFSSLFGIVNSIPQKALSTLMTHMTLPIFMYCLWVQRGLKCP